MKWAKIILKIFAFFLYTLLIFGISLILFVIYPSVTTKSSDVFMKNQFNIIKEVLSDKDNFNFSTYEDFNKKYDSNIEKSNYCIILRTLESGRFVYAIKLKHIWFITNEWNYFISGNSIISLEEKDKIKDEIFSSCTY